MLAVAAFTAAAAATLAAAAGPADPCQHVDQDAYFNLLHNSAGTRRSFFQKLNAVTDGYIAAPHDEVPSSWTSDHLVADGLEGFHNGTRKLGCYGDSVT